MEQIEFIGLPLLRLAVLGIPIDITMRWFGIHQTNSLECRIMDLHRLVLAEYR